jgi:hypothetical protein
VPNRILSSEKAGDAEKQEMHSMQANDIRARQPGALISKPPHNEIAKRKIEAKFEIPIADFQLLLKQA